MKSYLVIGGSSGIGAATVKNLSETGNRVFATYYKNPVHSDRSELEYHYLDVLSDELEFDYLPEKLHGLVFCPGGINLKPFSRIKPDEFIKDFDFQVVGAIKVLQAVLPKLKASEDASVVMFSTVAVQRGFNFHSQVAASKGAIEGLTKALAAELAPNIRVNSIAPSITDTPLASRLLNTDDKKDANAQRHPLKRVGKPEDIADLAGFLLSERADWITGQILHVDGGISSINV